jgi:hypothetical protein
VATTAELLVRLQLHQVTDIEDVTVILVTALNLLNFLIISEVVRAEISQNPLVLAPINIQNAMGLKE